MSGESTTEAGGPEGPVLFVALRAFVLGVCRIARDSAKVEGPCCARCPVRLLARTLNKTLEPDGPATGCNPVQVGSTPTGVSDAAGPTAHAALSSCEAVGDVCSVHGF